MTEYIRREDVLEFSRIFTDQVWETGGYRNCTTIAVPVEKIEEIPSADVVEVRHGKWEDDGLDGIGVFGIEYRWQKCSECGYTFTKIPAQPLHKFCPNCGARMDGGT